MVDEGRGNTIRVEVVVALPDRAHRFVVELPAGSRIGDALEACHELATVARIDARGAQVGIFGRRRKLSDPVSHGDRVEIYRPLKIDPKQARRRRAAKRSA
jgi:uncharacterized protein